MKILVLASLAESLVNFRRELLSEFVEKGNEVIACAPGRNPAVEAELHDIGVGYRPVKLERTGLNPLKDLSTYFHLKSLFKDIKPDILLCYTIKPVIFGSMAAKRAGVMKIYSIITGLGYAFSGGSFKRRALNFGVRLLYKRSLNSNNVVFFQNPDDQLLFSQLGIIDREKVHSVLINGSGVNLDYFRKTDPVTDPPVFLLIARLIKPKGVVEYAQAAMMLKKKYPRAIFRLLGPRDTNPSSISDAEIQLWRQSGVIDYLGETRDVRPYIAESGIYVLPSYREGTPRSVLEAMAMGRPIITTDAPGCRETVQGGVNGFLVPVGDANTLALAMEKFILNPGLIKSMGITSRELAEEKYNVHQVNKVILKSMEII